MITNQLQGGQHDQWGNLTNMGLVQWPWPNHTSMSTLHFLATLAPFFQVSGFLGLPPVSQGCLCVHRRAGNPDAPTPTGLLQIPIIYCHFSFYWGNDTDWRSDLSGRGFQCTQIFHIPATSDFPTANCVAWLDSINFHQIISSSHAKKSWKIKAKRNWIRRRKEEYWIYPGTTNDDWWRHQLASVPDQHFFYPPLPLHVTKGVKMALFLWAKTLIRRSVVFSHNKNQSNHSDTFDWHHPWELRVQCA